MGSIQFKPILLYEPSQWSELEEDKCHLQNLLGLFMDGTGMPVLAATYFIVDVEKGNNAESVIDNIQKVITLFRFSLLSAPHKQFSFEQTFLYLFELPPLYESETPEKGRSFSYRCRVNLQDDIYPHQGLSFYPAVPDLRTAMLSIGDLHMMELLSANYYSLQMGGLTNHEKERVLIAMDWYDQSLQEHPVRDERGKIVDMSTAFEVLLDLPQDKGSGAFRSGIEALLGGSDELRNWAKGFYDTRSEVVHRGKARSLLYKHPQAATEHIGLLGSARKIFAWCIETMMGEKRGLHAEEIVDLFTSNEVYLKRLKQAGSFKQIMKRGLLKEVGKLRPAYLVGKRQDIIWLGKVLLSAYKEQFITGTTKSLHTLDVILDANDDGRGGLTSDVNNGHETYHAATRPA